MFSEQLYRTQYLTRSLIFICKAVHITACLKLKLEIVFFKGLFMNQIISASRCVYMYIKGLFKRVIAHCLGLRSKKTELFNSFEKG